MSKPIIELMDEKILQLERYNEVTSKIIYENIDEVGDLIAERDKILAKMEGISAEVKMYVSEQSIERQDKINALLKFDEISDLSEDLSELQEKILRVKALREQIIENDKAAFGRIKKERDELKSKLEKAAKSKQVSEYFSQTAVDLTKGEKFNISN